MFMPNLMHPLKVISIGYERRSIDEFIELLKANDVKRLLDIREFPLSRKKGFSKKSLAAHLQQADIEYIHLRQAGNPFFKQRNELEKCLALYSEYLNNNPELVQNIAVELKGTSAMLCYERCHTDCHRSILLQAIRQVGCVFDLIQVE